MNTNDWKGVLEAVAPTIATALGGPLAGGAVAALSNALLGHDKGTVDELSPLVAGASPEVLLKIKNADLEYKTGLINAGVRLQEVEAADRDSARKRETETKDNTTKILAYAYTIGYFVTLAFVMKTGVRPEMENIVMVLLGVLTAAQAQIMNYYFGTSASSARKDSVVQSAIDKL